MTRLQLAHEGINHVLCPFHSIAFVYQKLDHAHPTHSWCALKMQDSKALNVEL
jgi:hypothetical protein